MQRCPLGETGEAVRKNVREARQERRLSLVALSRRTEKFGRRIPTLGLSRIEEGARRVDVDDLVVLSRALETDILTLLGQSQAGQEIVIKRPEVVVRLQITAAT